MMQSNEPDLLAVYSFTIFLCPLWTSAEGIGLIAIPSNGSALELDVQVLNW